MVKVITYGTFDLFHEGHYKLLERAKALGDYLIVGVTTQHFDEARGKINVVDPIMRRIENVQHTGFADEIIVEDHEGQKIEDIQRYDVDIFTVGSDWVGHFDYLNAFCKVIYLKRTPDISSTQIRKNRFQIIRIGIIGTGRLAPRFVTECRYVSGAIIPCAFNPEKVSAAVFGENHPEIQVFTDNFDAFLEEVDAIYIASPPETHAEYVHQAILHKKHVLTEKPLTFTLEEAREYYALAKKTDVVLMEGVRTAYCPGFQHLINVAKSGQIGIIRDVEACFSRLANPQSREIKDPLYGGAFLEHGGYPLLPIIKLYGTHYRELRIDCILDEKGIDLYTKIQLRYDQGLATAKMGVGVKSEGQLVIAGTKGYILAESPWWLTRRFDIRYEDPTKIDHYEPRFQGDGYRYEISEFIKRINGITNDGYKLTAEESIVMAAITEKFMEMRKKREKSIIIK